MSYFIDKITDLKRVFLPLFCLCKIVFIFAQDTTSAINDFDFYLGKWEVQNERMMDNGTWQMFTAKVEVYKTLNGYGNVDFFHATIDDEPYEGMTVRQYNAKKNQWQIRWYDSDDPIAEPTPSFGKFVDGKGEFYKTIQSENGLEVKVRFFWYDIKEDSFLWQSAWSIDGETWNPTWKMKFKKLK